MTPEELSRFASKEEALGYLFAKELKKNKDG